MKRSLLLTLFLFTVLGATNAQTVDEILAKYYENTGGIDNWKKIQSIKMSAKLNQGGIEIPLTIVRLKDGRQATSFTFQGKELRQNVYDGSVLWSTNFMTMKAEKADAETLEIFKSNLGDFPDEFLNYKSNGYKVEFLGKETIDGTEAFKVKLTKKPITVDGKLTDNITFYYFDAENYVPIMTESEVKVGPNKGIIAQSKMSDYQDVNGYLFPFSLAEGAKGGQMQGITITAIEVNPKVDEASFKFPEGQ